MVLFPLKRTAPLAVAAGLAFSGVGGTLRIALELPPPRPTLAAVALGVVAVVVVGAIDVAIHTAGFAIREESYRAAYADAVAALEGQTQAGIVASGVTAAGEEVFFRGAILAGAVHFGLHPALAICLAAVPFGLLHVLPDRARIPFGLWSLWQGIAFGGVFVLTGSLTATAVAHAVHDVVGSIAFAHGRRVGPEAPWETIQRVLRQ